MKKSIILIFLALIIPKIARADLGALLIQAICKITLIDGSEIEGIISFGAGGYSYNYKPHGFCFVHNNGYYTIKLFNLDFRQFAPSNLSAYRKGNTTLYYVQNNSLQETPESTFSFNDTLMVLTRTTTEIDQLNLKKAFLIYKELPLDLFIDYGSGKCEKVEVNVSELISFELVKEPSDYWLNIIEKSRTRLKGKMAEDEKNGEIWIDYMEPAWYHEIKKDKKQYHYLRQYF